MHERRKTMQFERMDDFFNRRAEIYDSHMLDELKLEEFYKQIAECFPEGNDAPELLDLGVGTGLELAGLFERFPALKVTGIDLSQGMLDILSRKYNDKKITAVCGSYFNIDFGKESYDFVLSTYSLHHFSKERKLLLYRKVFDTLRCGGTFIEGDYTCKTLAEQEQYIKESEQLCNENNTQDGYLHYDIPFTAETQVKLLRAANFSDVEVVREWDNTTIIRARKK